jgi:hypothetical protein
MMVVLCGYVSESPRHPRICSLCTNVEVLYQYVHMRVMVMLYYDYLVVKN